MIVIILFFIYLFGLGLGVSCFFRNASNFWERNLIRLGFGLGTFIVLGTVLNFFRIPIDWKIFLLVSFLPSYYLLKRELPYMDFKFTKSNLYILLVFLMFLFSFYMYHKGAFKYPYLEDDDPWYHSVGIKYVAIQKDLYTHGFKLVYLDPYPPAYDMLMGVLHQTSPSLIWTMKFFNALIVSLGIIFFYFFVKELSGNKGIALFSTFVLTCIPCYLSHFIWAHSLIPTLFFPFFYALERIKYERKYLYPASILFAAIFLTQPTQAIKFFVFYLIYLVVKIFSNKNVVKYVILTGIVGILFSSFWWGAMVYKYQGVKGIFVAKGGSVAETAKSGGIFYSLKTIFNPAGGTATRAYTFWDFLIAKKYNMINNPIGFGIVISILIFLGVLYFVLDYKNLKNWQLIVFGWFIFTFLGVNSLTFHLPIGLGAFRFWMLLAIPSSILASIGLGFLLSFVKKELRITLIIIIILGIIFTSGVQKFVVNTSVWPPGIGWSSWDELQGYLWLKNLPTNTKVFDFGNDIFIIGLDKYSCSWCPEQIGFKKGIMNKSVDSIYRWLKRYGYEYVIFGGRLYRDLKNIYKNETDRIITEKIEEFVTSEKFKVVHSTKGAIIMKVV